MSEDTAPYGTAPTAGLSNGQEIIAKTGTTNTAQSAFFIGAIPSQALAVALFTNEQGKGTETLDNLGGIFQGGGDGGTWPAAIWHTYAQDEFVPLGVEQFTHADLHRQRVEPTCRRACARSRRSTRRRTTARTARTAFRSASRAREAAATPTPSPPTAVTRRW